VQEVRHLKRYKDLNVNYVKRHISSERLKQVGLEESLQILLKENLFVTLSKAEVVML
jgi:hypothetical protein